MDMQRLYNDSRPGSKRRDKLGKPPSFGNNSNALVRSIDNPGPNQPLVSINTNARTTGGNSIQHIVENASTEELSSKQTASHGRRASYGRMLGQVHEQEKGENDMERAQQDPIAYIRDLERKSKKLISKEKYVKAVKNLSRAIHLKQASGFDEAEIVKQVQDITKVFNQFGMQLVNSNQRLDESQKIFSHLYLLLKRFKGNQIQQLIGLTLNNMSCCYERTGKIDEAQECLQMAMDYQNKANSQERKESAQTTINTGSPQYDKELHAGKGVTPKFEKSPGKNNEHVTFHNDDQQLFEQSPRQAKDETALTDINMCAVFSMKKDHRKALLHATIAIEKLNKELKYIFEKSGDRNSQNPRQNSPGYQQEIQDQLKEKHSLLAIAYYNQGCQQEYLKNFERSMDAYFLALKIELQKSQYCGGKGSPDRKSNKNLVEQFQRSYQDMKRKVNYLRVTKQTVAEKNNAKKTFTGLTKGRVDKEKQQSLNAKSMQGGGPSVASLASFGQKNVVTSGLVTSQRSTTNRNQFGMVNNPSRVSLNKQIQSAQNIENRRKRPMSAKAPNADMLKNNLINLQFDISDVQEDQNQTLATMNKTSDHNGEVAGLHDAFGDEDPMAYAHIQQQINDSRKLQVPKRPQVAQPRKLRPISAYSKKSELAKSSKVSYQQAPSEYGVQQENYKTGQGSQNTGETLSYVGGGGGVASRRTLISRIQDAKQKLSGNAGMVNQGQAGTSGNPFDGRRSTAGPQDNGVLAASKSTDQPGRYKPKK